MENPYTGSSNARELVWFVPDEDTWEMQRLKKIVVLALGGGFKRAAGSIFIYQHKP